MTLEIKAQTFEIYIPIYHKNTVIGGDSGTGKTYIVEKISSLVSEKALRNCVKSNIDFDNTIVIRNATEARTLDRKHLENKLIILDRADLYLNKSLVDFINKSKNTFIIMSRSSGVSGDILSSINAHMILKTYKKDDFVSIVGEPEM